MDSRRSMASRHRRSKSDSVKRDTEQKLELSAQYFQHLKLDVGKDKDHTDTKRKAEPVAIAQSSFNHEIVQLERRLKDQMHVRGAIEKALGYKPQSIDPSNDISMPKPTKELIREIAVLELEVVYLEQYLLSLYRRAFEQQVSNLSPRSPKKNSEQPTKSLQQRLSQEDSAADISSDQRESEIKPGQTPNPSTTSVEQVVDEDARLIGPSVHRCQSALSHRAVYSSRISPTEDSLTRALNSCHSQSLKFREDAQCTTTSSSSGVICLAEYLGTNIDDYIPQTPNKISEDMVRCMGAIYCKLADPPLVLHCIASSPSSSFSSLSAVSPQYLGDMWSPRCRKESTLNAGLLNPFRVEGVKEFSGPYKAMVEVPSICTDRRRLIEVEGSLQEFKSLAHRLETTDPRKLKNEEKLAFWINIHNALIMHAYLVYGILQKNTKKESLLIRAACIVGGRSVSAYTIQCYILGCRTHCPGQWLRSLLSPKMRMKTGGEWRAYGIENPEPLLHFALCSGSHSDPALRVYSYKRVFQQLEVAKEEYIRATVGIRNEEKVLLPKIVDTYSKDLNLSSQGVLDMIMQHLPQTLQMAMKRCVEGRSHRIIEWVSYNFNFRYLMSRELATSLMS